MKDFTNYKPNSSQQPQGALTGEQDIASEAMFFQTVYLWMFLALTLTAGMGYFLSTSALWYDFIANSPIFYLIALSPIAFVLFLHNKAQNMSIGALRGVLLAVAVCFGATTLPVCFVVYPTGAFVKAFVCTAGIYGSMAAYGLFTKRSLQALHGFLIMGLIGLILATIVNIFFHSGMADFVICIIGVLIFSGLTAYDHQKLRVIYFSASSEGADDDELKRYALFGSLELYLDFLNLFLFLLRLFGRSND